MKEAAEVEVGKFDDNGRVDRISREILKPEIREYVFRVCRKLLGADGSEYVDDATQETIIKALKKAGSFEERSDLKSWLYSIARSMVGSYYRRKKRISEKHEKSLGSKAQDPETFFPEEMRIAEIDFKRAISELEKEQKDQAQIIALRRMGFTNEEIADYYKITIMAAKSRIHRARVAFERILIKMGVVSSKKER